jgi:hypothetical protein
MHCENQRHAVAECRLKAAKTGARGRICRFGHGIGLALLRFGKPHEDFDG